MGVLKFIQCRFRLHNGHNNNWLENEPESVAEQNKQVNITLPLT